MAKKLNKHLKVIRNQLIAPVALMLIMLTVPASVMAALPQDPEPNTPVSESCPSGQAKSLKSKQCEPIKRPVDCSSGKVSENDPTKCVALGNGCNDSSSEDCLTQNPIIKNLNSIINFIAAGVGVAVIAVIIIGGIQYTLAGDNSSATGAAKQRIINGLIALVTFIFTFSLLQWLIPGGL